MMRLIRRKSNLAFNMQKSPTALILQLCADYTTYWVCIQIVRGSTGALFSTAACRLGGSPKCDQGDPSPQLGISPVFVFLSFRPPG